MSNICYDYYGRPYYCDSGLSYGARIGIGIGIAAAVVLLFGLCGYWRRRQLKNQWARYRPPALPTSRPNQEYSYGQGNNPYSNNPPPPQGYQGQTSFGGNNPYGSNPPPPPQVYQPSTAGQYGNGAGDGYGTGNGFGYGNKVRAADTGTTVDRSGEAEADHEHGYEWAQAREAERLERESTGAGVGADAAPPGYDVAATPQNTGYAPPAGAPPSRQV